MERIEHHVCFGGSQEVWRHHSAVTGTPMTFSVSPPQAKTEMSCAVLVRLTLQRAEFYHQSRGTALRSEHGLVIVAPDTSPRGSQVADDKEYDLGQGAGFYVNATQEPWKAHYWMYDYILNELHTLVSGYGTGKTGTVAKLAMRQPFVLFKGLTFQKLCLPGAFRPGITIIKC